MVKKVGRYYRLLEVGPDASTSEIRNSFLEFARKLHPDKVLHLSPEQQDVCRQRFCDLREAYGVLVDDRLRKLYDRSLAMGVLFQDLVEAERPETEVEKQAREAEDLRQEALGEATLDDLAERLHRVSPRKAGWKREEETYEYFDRVYSSREGGDTDTLLVKILSELSVADLPGIVSHAEGMLASVTRSLIRSNFAYLLVCKRLSDRSALLGQVESVNQRLWATPTGRSPRALISVCDVFEETALHPGAPSPRPDLDLLFRASTPPASTPDLGPGFVFHPAEPTSAPPMPPRSAQSSPGTSTSPGTPSSQPMRPTTSPGGNAGTPLPGAAPIQQQDPAPPLPGSSEAAGSGAPTPTGAAAAAQPEPAPLQPIILVVDDEEEQRNYLQGLLGKGAWQVLLAQNWPEFHHLVTTHQVTVALVDENLPDYTGGQLAQFVRTSDQVQPKPQVLYYSAMPPEHLHTLVAQTGANGFVRKGSSATDLVIKVSAAIERYQAANP